jgi:FeS assembly protein SufD
MTPNLTDHARDLRKNQTDAEKRLWSALRGRRFFGYRFHRQYVIGPYIADFVCRDCDLIIEVDGGQHAPDVDAERSVYLEAEGYRVIRFWNNEVLSNIEGVLAVIQKELSELTEKTEALTPTLSLKGEGEKERWKYSNLRGAVKNLTLSPSAAVWEMTGAFDFLEEPQNEKTPDGFDVWAGANIALRIPADVSPDRPVYIDLTAGDGQAVSGGIEIHLGAGANVTLIETQSGEGVYWKNLSARAQLAPGARLTHIRIVEDDPFAVYTQSAQIELAEDAEYRAVTMTTGGGFTRNDVQVLLAGPNAKADLAGASLLRGKQHGDTTIRMEHLAPQCTSSQFFRTILDGQARGVFQGKVHVYKDAQKTDGYQLSNAILLSPLAEMDTKPELEIYADDVKCSHGTTTGALDETPLFYLRSRGIAESEARKLLLEAFVNEILDKAEGEQVRETLTGKVNLWLSAI